jgi:hypothetical protein
LNEATVVRLNLSGHQWLVLSGAVAVVGNAFWGIRSGSIVVVHRYTKRTEDPPMFWCTVVFSMAVGLGAATSVFL